MMVSYTTRGGKLAELTVEPGIDHPGQRTAACNVPPRGRRHRAAGFKLLRILALLVLLLVAALSSWQDRYRSTRWQNPLFVSIYPIAADDSPVTRAYVAALDAGAFKPIDGFFRPRGGRLSSADARADTEPGQDPIELRRRSARPALGRWRRLWVTLAPIGSWQASGLAHEPEDIPFLCSITTPP